MKIRLFTQALLVLMLVTQPTLAMGTKFAIGATCAGATFLGLGIMFSVLATNADQQYAAPYNSTQFVISRYDESQGFCEQCYKHNGGCFDFPAFATAVWSYKTWKNGTVTSHDVGSGWKACGNTGPEASAALSQTVKLGTSKPMLYLIANPSVTTPSLKMSDLWGGAIFMFVFAAPTLFIGGFGLTKVLFCKDK